MSACGVESAARQRRVACLPVCVLALVAAGCGSKPEVPPVASTTAERGPISFTVVVSPKAPAYGQPLTVELRAETPEDHLVEFPDLDELKDADVTLVDASGPRPGAGAGLNWRSVFEVTPWLSGAFEIPPLVMKYASRPADPNESAHFDHELASSTLTINVGTALTEHDSIEQPRPITGTLLPPKPVNPWLWPIVWAAAVLALALAIAAIWLIHRRMTRPKPPLPADVWALRALSALAAQDLARAGRIREHYYGLSEILRRYIEKQIHVAAPEMTTDEFLTRIAREAYRWPAIDVDQLRVFMQSCDVVKYAAFEPDADAAGEALDVARTFVRSTTRAGIGSEASKPSAGGRAA